MASSLSTIIVAAFVIYLCYLQVQIMRFSRDRNEKNYILLLLVLFILVNFYFYYNIDFHFPLDLIIILGYAIMIGFFWLYNIMNKHVLKRNSIMKEIDKDFQEEKERLHEFLRKFFHFFVFAGSMTYILIYAWACFELIDLMPQFGAVFRSPWEDIPILADLNIDIIYDPDLFKPYLLQLACATFFMLALPFAIIVEFFRLNPKYGIPFHELFVKSLRPSEQYNVAHYYFFIFGIFISAVFLPATCVFAILCVLCFGDTFASLIGKRINREKKHFIRWEPEKCWEGTFAGFFFTIITAFLFVGWVLALLLALIFIAIDVITPEKLKISDNFLLPLLCTLVLLIFLSLGFQIDSIFANFFNDLNLFFDAKSREVIIPGLIII